MKIKEIDTYKTIAVLALASLIAFYIFKIKYLVLVSTILLVLPIIFYKSAYYITYGWLKFAQVLGGVNSKILLSVVFFIFLTPIAFLFRLFSKNMLQKSVDNKSYYSNRNHLYESKDLKNGW